MNVTIETGVWGNLQPDELEAGEGLYATSPNRKGSLFSSEMSLKP